MDLTLLIRDITSGNFKTFSLDINDSITIAELKNKISDKIGLPVNFQILKYNCSYLSNDNSKISEYNISDFSCLTLDAKFANTTDFNSKNSKVLDFSLINMSHDQFVSYLSLLDHNNDITISENPDKLFQYYVSISSAKSSLSTKFNVQLDKTLNDDIFLKYGNKFNNNQFKITLLSPISFGSINSNGLVTDTNILASSTFNNLQLSNLSNLLNLIYNRTNTTDVQFREDEEHEENEDDEENNN